MEIELSKEVLHLLDRLKFTPRIKTQRRLAGRHASPLAGGSPDFLEYREYSAGEKAADIDWRASAKGDRLLVRKREHQGLIQHWLVLDGSASMEFPHPEESKRRAQLLIAGALTHFLSGQGDAVGLLIEKEGGAIEHLAPRRTREGLAELIRRASAQPPVRAAPALPAALKILAEMLRSPAVVWAMTDFADAPGPALTELAHLAAAGHDVRVLHLAHPFEERPPWGGDCLLRDPEDAIPERRLHLEDLLREYSETYARHCEAIARALRNAGALYDRLEVTRPLEEILTLILEV